VAFRDCGCPSRLPWPVPRRAAILGQGLLKGLGLHCDGCGPRRDRGYLLLLLFYDTQGDAAFAGHLWITVAFPCGPYLAARSWVSLDRSAIAGIRGCATRLEDAAPTLAHPRARVFLTELALNRPAGDWPGCAGFAKALEISAQRSPLSRNPGRRQGRYTLGNLRAVYRCPQDGRLGRWS